MIQQLPQIEQYWQKVLQNEVAALEQIYRHFYPNLFQYAKKPPKFRYTIVHRLPTNTG